MKESIEILSRSGSRFSGSASEKTAPALFQKRLASLEIKASQKFDLKTILN
jgi:hypothetical protein